MGEQHVKSIARPVRAFRVAINQEALAEAPEETAPPQPPGIPTDSPTADSTALDLAVWETIRDSGDVEGFLHYLQRFPEGEFAEIARDRITALSQAPSQTLPVVTSAVDADTAVELSFWESVRVSDNLSLYFASQGAARLFWPLFAGLLRLLIAAGGGWAVLHLTGSLGWLFAALGGRARRLWPDARRRGRVRRLVPAVWRPRRYPIPHEDAI